MEKNCQTTADHNPDPVVDHRDQAAKSNRSIASASKKTVFPALAVLLAWFALGYLSFLSAQYFDLYVLSESKYFFLIDRIHFVFSSETAKFFIYHTYYMFSALALAFLFSGIFSAAFDFKMVCLVGFYVGAACLDIFQSCATFASAADVYVTIPAHLAHAATADLIKFTILLPSAIYSGARLGRKLNARLTDKLPGEEIDIFCTKGEL